MQRARSAESRRQQSSAQRKMVPGCQDVNHTLSLFLSFCLAPSKVMRIIRGRYPGQDPHKEVVRDDFQRRGRQSLRAIMQIWLEYYFSSVAGSTFSDAIRHTFRST